MQGIQWTTRYRAKPISLNVHCTRVVQVHKRTVDCRSTATRSAWNDEWQAKCKIVLFRKIDGLAWHISIYHLPKDPMKPIGCWMRGPVVNIYETAATNQWAKDIGCYLSIYLSTYLSIYLSTYLYIFFLLAPSYACVDPNISSSLRPCYHAYAHRRVDTRLLHRSRCVQRGPFFAMSG